MEIQFKRPHLPGLPQPVNELPENLPVNLQIYMTGALMVFAKAPDTDQKLFLLVPESERAKLIARPWVRETLKILEPAINTILEQTLLRMHLHPVSTVVQPGYAIDQNGKLLYTFQIPVQTFPAGAAQTQQGAPLASDGTTPQ